jgi:stage IV sporulation protein FB
MSTHTTATSGGLRFAVFGVPVTVRASAPIFLGILGFGMGDTIVTVLFVVIGLVSILLHELGHALVARLAGAQPQIELAGLGGVTRYPMTPKTATRGWALAIGLAGPAVGLLVGGAALLLRPESAGVSARTDAAWSILVFTSIGWSVLNLLPVPPMDGGQAMTQLLPGDPVTRRRRGAAIGIGTAVLLAAGGVVLQQTLIILFGLLFAFQNYQTMQALRPQPERDEAADADAEAEAAPTLATQGRAAREWFAAGNGTLEQLAELQQQAAAEGLDQLAAELGEIALRRGATDPAFAVRSARAWHALGVRNRALAAVEGAVALGADAALLAQDASLPTP